MNNKKVSNGSGVKESDKLNGNDVGQNTKSPAFSSSPNFDLQSWVLEKQKEIDDEYYSWAAKNAGSLSDEEWAYRCWKKSRADAFNAWRELLTKIKEFDTDKNLKERKKCHEE